MKESNVVMGTTFSRIEREDLHKRGVWIDMEGWENGDEMRRKMCPRGSKNERPKAGENVASPRTQSGSVGGTYWEWVVQGEGPSSSSTSGVCSLSSELWEPWRILNKEETWSYYCFHISLCYGRRSIESKSRKRVVHMQIRILLQLSRKELKMSWDWGGSGKRDK